MAHNDLSFNWVSLDNARRDLKFEILVYKFPRDFNCYHRVSNELLISGKALYLTIGKTIYTVQHMTNKKCQNKFASDLSLTQKHTIITLSL